MTGSRNKKWGERRDKEERDKKAVITGRDGGSDRWWGNTADSYLSTMVSPVLKGIVNRVSLSLHIRDAKGEKNCFIEKKKKR